MKHFLFKILFFRWKYSVAITLFASIFSAAHAQNLQTEVQNAMRYAITYGVDEQTHQSFWSKLSPKEKRELSESRDFLEIGQSWQYAFWESASETVRARTIIRTESYINAFEKFSNLVDYKVILIKPKRCLGRLLQASQ